jgi:hypothetical protein
MLPLLNEDEGTLHAVSVSISDYGSSVTAGSVLHVERKLKGGRSTSRSLGWLALASGSACMVGSHVGKAIVTVFLSIMNDAIYWKKLINGPDPASSSS